MLVKSVSISPIGSAACPLLSTGSVAGTVSGAAVLTAVFWMRHCSLPSPVFPTQDSFWPLHSTMECEGQVSKGQEKSIPFLCGGSHHSRL